MNVPKSLKTCWLAGVMWCCVVDVVRSKELMAALGNGHPKLLLVTEYSTLTVKVVTTSYTSAICAHLINVTGTCQPPAAAGASPRSSAHGRSSDGGRHGQQPVVLTFEEDMDEIDQLLQPTKTLTVETTAVLPAFLTSEPVLLEGSKEDVIIDDAAAGSKFLKPLKPLKPFLDKIKVAFVKYATTTKTWLVTHTYTTKTAYILGCTPAPFPLSLCNDKKRVN